MKILVITPVNKFDYLAAAIIEGLRKLNIEAYFTSPGNGVTETISDDKFISLYPECDYIFALWSKCIDNKVPEPKYYLIDKVNGWDKTVYIDGSEYNYTGYPSKTKEQFHPLFKQKAKWYFKRECLPEYLDQNVIPLPFAATSDDFSKPKDKKTIDVLCAFGQTDTGLRKLAIEACNELRSEGYTIITGYAKNYLETIQDACITIDAHGGGECNARMWQVMANRSCLFAQKYSILFPELHENKHYISWNSKEELKEKIRFYLEHKDLLLDIMMNGYNNILQHHTPGRRIEYILKHIGNVNDNDKTR